MAMALFGNRLDTLESLSIFNFRIRARTGGYVVMRTMLMVAAVAAFSLTSCATAPTTTVAIKPVAATVQNVSGKAITAINYQPCGDASGWYPLPIGSLPSGVTKTVDLPSDCVNLQAFNADGRLAGSQSGVNRKYPFTWVIR